jgi:hypothetical protein
MIFSRWIPDKTMRELRKAKKRLSLRNYAMSPEEQMRQAEETLKWWAEKTGKPARVVDNSKKQHEQNNTQILHNIYVVQYLTGDAPPSYNQNSVKTLALVPVLSPH